MSPEFFKLMYSPRPRAVVDNQLRPTIEFKTVKGGMYKMIDLRKVIGLVCLGRSVLLTVDVLSTQKILCQLCPVFPAFDSDLRYPHCPDQPHHIPYP
jgi:hypothetical protein